MENDFGVEIIEEYRPSLPSENWLFSSANAWMDQKLDSHKMLKISSYENDSTGAETPRNEKEPFGKSRNFKMDGKEIEQAST